MRRGSVGSARALVAVVIWGASFAATKRLLEEVAPATVLFGRTALATVVIAAAVALRSGLRPIPARDWPRLIGLAVVGLVLTPLLQAWALELSTSANTAWLVALNPVVTVVLAAALLGERLAGKAAGLAVAFAGAVLVVTGGSSLGPPSTRGDLLTVVSTVTWALYTVYGRHFISGHDPPLVTVHLLGIAGLAYLPGFVAGAGWRELGTLSAGGWGCLVYLGVGCSGLGLMLYYAALEHLEASQAAAFIYVEPLIAQALAVVALGEPLTVGVVAGGAAILTGVFLVSRSENPAQSDLDRRPPAALSSGRAGRWLSTPTSRARSRRGPPARTSGPSSTSTGR